MSNLSQETIAHLAHLARLQITQEEEERYAEQLTAVVGYVEQLSAVSTESVSAEGGVTGLTTVLAADIPRAEGDLTKVDHKELLSGAPAIDGDYILVRAVMGDEAVSA